MATRAEQAQENAAAADAALAAAAQEGIHRLAIPTPFLVGRVNLYLLEDDPLTLVDTGPNSGKALDEVERQLADLGHRVEDLELILLTHQHMDHVGLVDILGRRSGAEIAALDLLVPYMADHTASAEADDAFASALMLRHGIPVDVAHALRAVSAAFRAWGSRGDVTTPLRAGESLTLRDRTLQAFHRPGHSPSDTVFWDERRGLLLGGDHLIAHISSNPLVSRPLGLREGSQADPVVDRPRALIAYLDSLRATQAMPIGTTLPGHGDPVTDHVALIDSRFRLHSRRADKIARILAGRPRSAYEIATEMWGNVAVTQAYLTLSEVLGHLDLLVVDGRARELVDDEVARFEAIA